MPICRVTMAATETATRAAHALDDLYRAHVGEVYRYAYAVLGNHADAEDVTQTTFVNALRALERGDRPRKPSNWLITIAHNVVRQRFRTQKARPVEVELVHDIAVEEQAHDGPTLDELVKGLQRIPPTQREALVMRELEGRSYREIQQILELTPAALEMLLFRARRSLAEELENVVTCELAELALSKRLDGAACRARSGDGSRSISTSAPPAHGWTRAGRSAGVRSARWPCCRCRCRSRSSGAPRSASAATGLPTIGTGGARRRRRRVDGHGRRARGAGVAVKAVALVAAVTAAAAVGYAGRRTGRRPRDGEAAHRALGGDGRAGRRAAGRGPGGSQDGDRRAPQGATGPRRSRRRRLPEQAEPLRRPRQTTPAAAGARAARRSSRSRSAPRRTRRRRGTPARPSRTR